MNCCITGSLASSPLSADVHGCGPGGQIRLFSGDDLELTVTIRENSTGDLIDLTGATIFFQVRPDESTPPTITKSSATITEIEVLPQIDPTLGQFKLFLLPADTASLGTVQYIYGITLQLAGGDVVTAIQGGFVVTKRVVDLAAPPVTPGEPAPQTEAERSFTHTVTVAGSPLVVPIPGAMINDTYTVAYAYHRKLSATAITDTLLVSDQTTAQFQIETSTGNPIDAGAEILFHLRDQPAPTSASGVPHGPLQWETLTGVRPSVLFTFQSGADSLFDTYNGCDLPEKIGSVSEIVAPDGFFALRFAAGFARLRQLVPIDCGTWDTDMLFAGLVKLDGDGRVLGRNDADFDGYRLLLNAGTLEFHVRSLAGAETALATVTLPAVPASGYYGFAVSLVDAGGGSWTASAAVGGALTVSDTQPLTAEVSPSGFSCGAFHTGTAFFGDFRLLAHVRGAAVAGVDLAALATVLQDAM